VSKAAGPKGNAASWFGTDDYPARALREEAEGTVVMAFDIGADGRVTSCRISQSSGNSDLDETSCRLMMRRGRFSPALDQAGNPIASTGTRRVTWKMP
jgi:protein TonB